jgi:hypothetical protein
MFPINSWQRLYAERKSPAHGQVSLVHCLVSPVHCLVSSVHCLVSPVHCLVSPVHCLVSPVHGLVSSVHCLVSPVHCLVNPGQRVLAWYKINKLKKPLLLRVVFNYWLMPNHYWLYSLINRLEVEPLSLVTSIK